MYGPIHYQELPELFMDYVCSLTGKSPSTTGAGSEERSHQGPFTALCATADLNNALVSMLLCGYAGFSSAAGLIGPRFRADHDVSVLIPEIWCRLFPQERDPARLIAAGHLERLSDYEYEGKMVLASRLRYRITQKFVHTFFGRVFDNPSAVFTEEILKPEIQAAPSSLTGFTTSSKRIGARSPISTTAASTTRVRRFAPCSTSWHGHFEGKDVHHPEVRASSRAKRCSRASGTRSASS